MARGNKHQSSVKLELSGSRITADIFSRSVRTFFELVEDVAVDVTGARKGIEWIVSVKSGSITICATPESISACPTSVAQAIRAIATGIESIGKRTKRPAHFSDNALRKLRELGNIVGFRDRGLDRILIRVNGKSNELSPASVAYVDELLGTPMSAYGTIEGKLLAVNVKGRLKFSVYETLTNRSVTCFVGDEKFEDVVSAIKDRVSAYGLIRYRKTGEPASIEIEDLSVFPPEDKLPKFSDMVGIFKD